MKNDDFGDRMKGYESVTRQVLPRRTYTIVRLDGRSFHTFLKRAQKPFDYYVIEAMDWAAQRLCEEMAGARFAYTQSDEISVLLTDLEPQSQPWFGGVVQKIVSVAASIATVHFNHHYGQAINDPVTDYGTFDARVYTIPSRIEVANYFIWRQKDAIRNAVSMVAQSHFRPGELHGVKAEEMQEMLFQREGINFKTDYGPRARRGGVVVRKEVAKRRVDPRWVQYMGPDAEPIADAYQKVWRHVWSPQEAPDFTLNNGGFLACQIPAEPDDVLRGVSPESCDHESWEADHADIPVVCSDCGYRFTVRESIERLSPKELPGAEA